jgi:hypothetical protein
LCSAGSRQKSRNHRRRASLFCDMRVAAALAVCAAVAVCAPPATVAKKLPYRASSCQKLRAGQKDLAPSRALVLVVRGTREVGDISACLLPRGRLRTLTLERRARATVPPSLARRGDG